MENLLKYVPKMVNEFKKNNVTAKNLPELDRADIRQFFGINDFNLSKKLHDILRTTIITIW